MCLPYSSKTQNSTKDLSISENTNKYIFQVLIAQSGQVIPELQTSAETDKCRVCKLPWHWQIYLGFMQESRVASKWRVQGLMGSEAEEHWGMTIYKYF